MIISKSHARLVAIPMLIVGLAISPHLAASTVQWLESPLAGPDRDNDGIRDDVGIQLESQYSHASELHWAREVARASQRFIISDDNPFAIYRAQAEMRRAVMCLEKISDRDHTARVRDNVLGLVLNTETRKQAFESAVASWEKDVRYRELPERPDDRWTEGCGKFDKPVPKIMVKPAVPVAPAVVEKPMAPVAPSVVNKVDTLPPPNFFKSGEVPKAPAGKAESSENLPASVQVPEDELNRAQEIPEWARVPVPGEKPAEPEKLVQQPTQPVMPTKPAVPPPMEDKVPAPKPVGVGDYVKETDGISTMQEPAPVPQTALPVLEVPEPSAEEVSRPKASQPDIPVLEVPEPQGSEAPVSIRKSGSKPAVQQPAVPVLEVPEPVEADVNAGADKAEKTMTAPEPVSLPVSRENGEPAAEPKMAKPVAPQPLSPEAAEARRKLMSEIGLSPSRMPESGQTRTVPVPASNQEPAAVKPAPKPSKSLPRQRPEPAMPTTGTTPTSSIDNAPTADGYKEGQDDGQSDNKANAMEQEQSTFGESDAPDAKRSGATVPRQFESLGPYIKSMEYELDRE